MKIVLTTTFLVTFVAMDIVGINYAFGQVMLQELWKMTKG